LILEASAAASHPEPQEVLWQSAKSPVSAGKHRNLALIRALMGVQTMTAAAVVE
jgi:hypothetical protein